MTESIIFSIGLLIGVVAVNRKLIRGCNGFVCLLLTVNLGFAQEEELVPLEDSRYKGQIIPKVTREEHEAYHRKDPIHSRKLENPVTRQEIVDFVKETRQSDRPPNLTLFFWDRGYYKNRSSSEHAIDLSNLELSGVHGRVLDIYSMNLSHSDLSGSNFEHADFTDCDFSNANLAGVNFRYSEFFNTILIGANFEGADLEEATLLIDFQKANFRNANLKNADLSFGNFEGADFTGADLSGIKFKNANFKDARGIPEEYRKKSERWKFHANLWLRKIVIAGILIVFAALFLTPPITWHKNRKQKPPAAIFHLATFVYVAIIVVYAAVFAAIAVFQIDWFDMWNVLFCLCLFLLATSAILTISTVYKIVKKEQSVIFLYTFISPIFILCVIHVFILLRLVPTV